MSELPVCLVIGLQTKDPHVIVKGLLQQEELSSNQQTTEIITCHTWCIVNKYYSASVQICSASSTSCIDETLKSNIQAAVVYFDSQNKDGLNLLETLWLPLLEDCECLDVKILVCDTCQPDDSETGISKLEAQQWCIKHGFELVELDSSEKPDPDDEFPDTVGIERIIQALHAHSWPNLEFKDQGERKKRDVFSETLLSKATEEEGLEESLLKFGTSGDADHPAADGIDSFEELFQAMSMMKSQASALQGAERKAYAEKITMAFWRAIDGDSDEIAGLDSSGDDEQQNV